MRKRSRKRTCVTKGRKNVVWLQLKKIRNATLNCQPQTPSGSTSEKDADYSGSRFDPSNTTTRQRRYDSDEDDHLVMMEDLTRRKDVDAKRVELEEDFPWLEKRCKVRQQQEEAQAFELQKRLLYLEQNKYAVDMEERKQYMEERKVLVDVLAALVAK